MVDVIKRMNRKSFGLSIRERELLRPILGFENIANISANPSRGERRYGASRGRAGLSSSPLRDDYWRCHLCGARPAGNTEWVHQMAVRNRAKDEVTYQLDFICDDCITPIAEAYDAKLASAVKK